MAYSKSNNDPRHTHELSLKFGKLQVLSKMPAVLVNRRAIQSCLDELAEDNGWTGSTYNRYMAAISLVFRIAIDSEKLSVNQAHSIRRKQENNSRVRFLSQEEEAPLTAVITIRNPEYLPIYLLAPHTGMRLSEQLRSEVGDYDQRAGTMLIRQ